MRALIWDGARARVAEDAPAPAASAGSAVVRVSLAGICSTDLQILEGYMAFKGVLGHEFAGRVEDGPRALVGKRVVGEINFACRRCATCLAGRVRHCPTRLVLGILGADGAFAERVRLPVENLHPVPDEVPDEEAVFTEPAAAAIEASVQSAGFAGGRTAVVGAGKLGLLVAQVLAARGDQVRVVCRSAPARETTLALGLEAVSLRDAPRDNDLVVEATGDPQGLALALELVRPLGAVILKSTVAHHHQLDLAPLVINEVTLIGSRCGDFVPALDAIRTGLIRVRPLIEARYPLAEATRALEHAARPGSRKILLAA
jgi:threonine dehydrogenase-like Zn-dependent dehydrogenase